MSAQDWLGHRRWDVLLAVVVASSLAAAGTAVAHVRTTSGAGSTGTAPAVAAPGAPRSVAGAAASGMVITTWQAPLSDGGSPITAYLVIYTDASRPAGGIANRVGAGTLGDSADLVPGDRYTVSVSAVNAHGTGPRAADAAPVVPYTVAGAPTDARATGHGGRATVSWKAPSSTGYTVVTGYRISIEDRTVRGTRSIAVGTATEATVGGLTTGHRYLFSVAALNAAGVSAPSPTTQDVVVPVLVTSAPTGPRPAPTLAVSHAALPAVIAVGPTAISTPFALTLNRPGAVTVSLLRGAAVAARTAIPAGSATIRGAVVLDITRLTQLGTYTWVVTDTAAGRVLTRQSTRVSENSMLALRLTRRQGTLVIHGTASFASLQDGRVVPWAREQVSLQRLTAAGWVTVGTYLTNRQGHIAGRVTAPRGVRLRLVDATGVDIIGMTSAARTG